MKPYYILEPDHSVRVAESFDQWMLWVRKNFEDMEVALTIYPHCHVRTAFLGVEVQGEEGTNPPTVFETVIIGGPHDAKSVAAQSWAEAHHNHVRISELLAKETLTADSSDALSPFME